MTGTTSNTASKGKPRAPYYVVKCPDCSREQTVFSRPSTKVTCTICGSLLATPTGGLGKFRSEILRTV
ncbi:MAG: 30S ribosomal protein S27e [Candidatus Thermoplasmatota archaeon]|jgi:small subunit ribosomal protein S27e|nr:30S ribosomal protein S27e [Candidatus Thermoplasmatota archaeon]MCL5984427.1 30S ribosomal protein S27e [Candidatus Thermoplasmatota archaeon]